jgi:hypothetical protein
MLIFQAPALVHAADEGVLVQMGSIVYPRFVVRRLDQNGFFLTTERDAASGRSVIARTCKAPDAPRHRPELANRAAGHRVGA